MRTPSTVRPTGSGVPRSREPGWPHLCDEAGRCGRPARMCLNNWPRLAVGWPWLAGAGLKAGLSLICRWRGLSLSLSLSLSLRGRTTAAASLWPRGAAGGGRGAPPRCRPIPRVSRAAPRAPGDIVFNCRWTGVRRCVFRHTLPRCSALCQHLSSYRSSYRSINLSIYRAFYLAIHPPIHRRALICGVHSTGSPPRSTWLGLGLG